ncbi:MAG: carbohydrate kinase family protein [Pyrinomonadaceae bacterium]
MRFPFALAPEREFDVAGFGTNAVDYLIRVPHYPEFNSKVELVNYVQAAGGEVATTMAGLSRLGLRTAYAGKFGGDAAGDFGMRSLRDEGVDIAYSAVVADARTQIAFIVIDIGTGERTVIWQRDERLAFTADEAPIELVTRSSILHLTPHDVAACLRLANEARRVGTIVSIDVDNVFPGIEELLPLVDLLITSAEFPQRLLGLDDHRRALAEMRSRYGCGVAGVTLGSKGSLLLCGETYIQTPGFAVPGGCQDTTGAGDSFRVGLLYGLARGWSVEDAARTANAVAALKCRAVGARTSLPTADELDRFLSGERS